ncbi:MAG: hypothetical protein OEM02_15240, partial [Desulfobulbaceae bacterium]|nr:hypothetical protein [Desulfobulbaceae bacterium]
IAADREGHLMGAEGLEVKLIRQERDYYWQYDEHRGWRNNFSENVYTVMNQKVSIGQGEKGTLNFPVENGHYRLEISDPVHETLTAHEFHVGQSWWWYGHGEQGTRPDSLTMLLDKKKYQAGDTAQLTITSPHNGRGFVVVESDEPLWSAPLEIKDGTVKVEIPVDPAWKRHDIYISAMVLRPMNGKEKITVNRVMGLVHLPLDREDRRLHVTMDAPERMEPLSKLKVSMQVETMDQKPATDVMITIAAVDVGALNVTGYKTPDPFSVFFGQRRYSVESRDLYSKVIEAMDGERASLAFGGDMELSRGGTRPMSDVQIVSLFNGPVTMDENGHGTVELDIPDFNGRLRLASLAFSADKFGKGETTVTVAAPVVAELGLPRFLAPGDESTFTLELTNMTQVQRTLTWNLEPSDNLQLAMKEEHVVLGSGEKITRPYGIMATGYGPKAKISLRVSHKGEGEQEKTFARQWSLGLRPAYPAMQRRHNVVLQLGEVVHAGEQLLEGLDPATLEGSISVSNRPPLNISAHLSYLLHYPYGCLEQTTGAAFPFLLVDDTLLTQLKINNWDHAHRSEAVDMAVSRLATMQRHNGGFGLWSSSSPEEHYLTVLATDFLLAAEKHGYSVPKGMLSSAIRRLQYYLDNGPTMGLRYSEDAAHYRFAYRSYAGYVLAGLKKANLGSLRTLYDRHGSEAKSGLPLVHLGLGLMRMGDGERGHAAVNKGLALERTVDVYYGDYGSPIRDTGLMLALLLEHETMQQEGSVLIFELVDLLRGASYLSTQERIALLRAEIGLRAQRGVQWRGLFAVGDKEQQIGSSDVFYHLFGKELGKSVSFTSDNPTPLYAQLAVNGYGTRAPEPESNGVDIERFYYSLEGQPVDLQKVRSGDLLLVSLNVSAKQRVPDLLVADLLPAGLELENQNLLNAVKLDEIIIDGEPVSHHMQSATIAHQEYRDDRFVAALDQYPHQVSRLYYLARAVTPGTYTIPPTLAEDMYRPMIRAVGKSDKKLIVHPATPGL